MTLALADTDWDAIVIGTGMGGGTLGRALAEAGQRVLFVEKGGSGHRAEANGLSEIFVPEARLTRGLWPDPIHVSLNGLDQAFYAPLGAGVGGSSVFYAATLERPERHDLDALPDRAHPTGGWPVGYDAMTPWYARAAQTYEVYGAPDPLSPEPPLALRTPPTLNATETALMTGLRDAGLHPYHAHTALRRIDGCENCLGRKCPRPCKMDSRSAGVEPALATGNATVVEHAEVLRLEATADRITGVTILHQGSTHLLTAKRYILSAGALNAPRVLMASANEHWPNGIGNHSDLVGRNLMFHLNEMFALWPRGGDPDDGATKAVSLRDLYHHKGARFGTLQAMGIRASYGEIVHYLTLMLDRTWAARLPGKGIATRAAAALAERLFGDAQIFVGLMEDLPYADNRVLNDPDKLAIRYQFQPELLARRKAFRKAIWRAFKGHRRFFLGRMPELNYGHPCGTLRFGTDPAQSVLDPSCRVHGLRNLWAVDASFMPSSMGVNPSLTVAANALRVADTLLREPMP